MQAYTHDGEPITKALQSLNHSRPATLAGLAVCITGIVPNLKGTQAETAAQRRGARTTKNVSSKTQLLVIGDNAGDTKIQRAEYFNTPIITSDEFLALI
jgi:replication factor C subunit 1